MKTCILWFLTLACVLCFAGCDRWTDADTTRTGADIVLTETGHPSGEIQIPQIFCQGQLYYYRATGFGEALPPGYEYLGSITAVDNINVPAEEFCGARVTVGQEIYGSEHTPDLIYVRYENGYARFSAET